MVVREETCSGDIHHSGHRGGRLNVHDQVQLVLKVLHRLLSLVCFLFVMTHRRRGSIVHRS